MTDGLTFDEYQARALTTAIYDPNDAVTYPVVKLFSEAGEVACKIGKLARDDGHVLSDARRAAITGEAGDAAWYIAAACHDLGLTMGEVAGCIDFETFQHENGTVERAAYAGDKPLLYLALRLGQVVGDVCGMVASEMDGSVVVPLIHKFSIRCRLHGILRCLAAIAVELDVPLEAIARANLAKLADRAARGVLHGDGDQR